MKFQNYGEPQKYSSSIFKKNIATSTLMLFFIKDYQNLIRFGSKDQSVVKVQLKQYLSKICLFSLPTPQIWFNISKSVLVDSMPVEQKEYRQGQGRFQYYILLPTDKNNLKAASVSPIFKSLLTTSITFLQQLSPILKNYLDYTLSPFIESLINPSYSLPFYDKTMLSKSLMIQQMTSLRQMYRYQGAFSASKTSFIIQLFIMPSFSFVLSFTIYWIIYSCMSYRNVWKLTALFFLKLKLKTKQCSLSKIVYLVWFQMYYGDLYLWIQGSSIFFDLSAKDCFNCLNFSKLFSTYDVLPMDYAPTKKARFQPLILPFVQAELRNCMKNLSSSGQF